MSTIVWPELSLAKIAEKYVELYHGDETVR